MIKFNQKDQLKTFVDMNTKLRQKAKNDFQKDFFKLMNNAVSGKTMENVKKYRDIKPVTTERRRNYLVSEPNYHTTKFFKRKYICNRNEKNSYINKYVCLFRVNIRST